MSREPGAVLKMRLAKLGGHPTVELDGLSLGHCLQGITIEWENCTVPTATITVGLRDVDLDVVTLCYLIGKTESPVTIEEAIRALRRIKAEVADGRE